MDSIVERKTEHRKHATAEHVFQRRHETSLLPEPEILLLVRDDGVDTRSNERLPDSPCSGEPDMAMTLLSLLMRYVDLLEVSKHANWSPEDENTVRTAVSVLDRSGWSVKLPRYA